MSNVITECKVCGFPCVKFGFNKLKFCKKQCYYCRRCSLKFTNVGLLKVRYEIEIIATAINWYYEGFSLRKIKRNLNLIYGINPNHYTILKWIRKYSTQIKEYIDEHYKLKISNSNFVDETVIKCKGKNVWLWGIIDNNSRYLIDYIYVRDRNYKTGLKLFTNYRDKIINYPINIISDGLKLYPKVIRRTFPKTVHINLIRFDGLIHNNIVERFWGTIKDKTKVCRGFKNLVSTKSIIDGLMIHYNFVKPHETLNGSTPAKAIGIGLSSSLNENKWLDLLKLCCK